VQLNKTHLLLLSWLSQTDQEDTPESTYQATFDTCPDGDWTTVRLPWHNFVPVKRAQSDPKGAPLDPSRISKLGLVLSRCGNNLPRTFSVGFKGLDGFSNVGRPE
jgi:hypothetical protein